MKNNGGKAHSTCVKACWYKLIKKSGAVIWLSKINGIKFAFLTQLATFR
jgi:hypothetical protein